MNEAVLETKNQLPKDRVRTVDSLDRSRASSGRKRAVASAILSPGGSGRVLISVNGSRRDASEVFPRKYHLSSIIQPLVLCGNAFDVVSKVRGGGKTGQAQALRSAISLAIVKQNPTLYALLRREGLMTRDPRIVEPKKTAQPKARKNKPTSRR